jgi:hypothetical protein
MGLQQESKHSVMRSTEWFFKAKIAAKGRDLCSTCVLSLVGGFNQGSDAASTQSLANHTSILVNRDFLKVWLELSFGCSHRVASILTEGGLFSTLFTDRHDVVLSQL